jgi:uncharacterized phage protein (TIGR01671 family)
LRVIKFRGIRQDTGEWAYGDFMRRPSGAFISYICEAGHFQRFVDENTIGQFTGLVDSAGMEIFEGDIVEIRLPAREYEFRPRIKAVISFQNGCFWFDGEGHTDCNWHFYNAEDRTVIGNIFENSELLSKEKMK